VVVCDGWRSYPNFTGRIQRCWAHLLREAKGLAEHVEEAGPLSEELHGLYRRLNVPPMDRPPPDEAERLAEEARALMETWAGRPYEAGELRRFAAKMLSMCLAAFEMGRVSALSLESRIVLDEKRADSALFPTS
jgi:hypothetical protein